MNRQVSSALERICSASKALNQNSDQLSEKIAEIEAQVNRFKLGVWVWLDESLSQEEKVAEDQLFPPFTIITSLGYGKIRDKWGFVVSVCPDDDPSEPDLTFLKDAPRELRAKAVDKIPALLDSIADKAAKLSEKISKKAKLAEEIAISLKKSNADA